MALSLLSNCATQPEVLKAVSTSRNAAGQPSVVAVTKLLSNQDPALSTKAATLIGNLCHDSTLRSQVLLTAKIGTAADYLLAVDGTQLNSWLVLEAHKM